MLKYLKKKSVLAAIFITGAVILIFALFGNDNFLSSGIKTLFSPVLTLTSRISDEAGNFKDYLIELKVYKEENERLNSEINRLKSSNREVAELTSENERLKELLSLQSSLEYNTKAGLVISNEPNNRKRTFVINKGSNDGVKVGAAVLSADGVVGKISETGLGWSRVSSVLNDEIAVGVRILRTGKLAVLEGDSKLAKSGCCKIDIFDKGTQMVVGDIVETTGAAGVYPEGWVIGTVSKIQTDSDGKEYAIVETAVDFNNLYEVLIVMETVGE